MATFLSLRGPPAPAAGTAPADPHVLLAQTVPPVVPPPARALPGAAALACGATAGLALAVGSGARRRPRAAAPRAAHVARRAAKVGDKVIWSGKHKGTVRFVGETKFSSGEWVGVELEEPVGWHNGTLMGVSYFECAPQHGVFALPSRVRPVGGPEAPAAAAAAPPAAAAAAPAAAPAKSAAAPTKAGAIVVGQRVLWSGKHEGVVRFIGRTHFAEGEWVGVELDAPHGKHDGNFMGVEYFHCEPDRGIFAQAHALQTSGTMDMKVLHNMLAAAEAKAGAAPSSTPAAPAAAAPPPAAAPAAGGARVRVGDRVRWSGHDGVVRFLGGTQFAEGEWVGVELDTPAGRHDGSFMGTTYFTCKPNHGVFCQAGQLQVSALA